MKCVRNTVVSDDVLKNQWWLGAGGWGIAQEEEKGLEWDSLAECFVSAST